MSTKVFNHRHFVFTLGIVLLIVVGIVFPITAQEAPSHYISSLKWSPDGETIAVSIATNQEEGCYQNPDLYAIRLINSMSGDILLELKEDLCSVNSVDFSPHSTRLASSSRVGIIGIWNLATYQREVASQIFTNIYKVEWSRDGTLLLTVHAFGVDLYETQRLELINSSLTASSVNSGITNATWSPDGLSIAISSMDGNVYLWYLPNNSMFLAFDGHASAVTTAIWNPGENTIASADTNGTIHIWNVEGGRLLATLTGHNGQVRDLVWNPDGETLASAGTDGTVRIWNTNTGALIEAFNDLEEAWALDYSPYGGRLVFGGRTVRQYATHNSISDALEIVVPAPSLDRLNAIAALCVRDASSPTRAATLTRQSVTESTLADFVAQVKALPDDAIPPACRADLLVVAGALSAAGEQSR